MKKNWCIILIALLILSAGCTAKPADSQPQTPVETPKQEEAAPQEPAVVEPVSTKILRTADWVNTYPEVYESFKLGATVIKDDGSNRTHSHANLMETCTNQVAAKYSDMSVYFNTVTMRCLFCKSDDALELYNKYGDDAFEMSYNEVIGMVEDMWGCYMCHENEPGKKVTATIPFWVPLTANTPNPVPAADSTCGQCHNALGAFRALEGLTVEMMESFTPYKYGYKADDMRRAFTEQPANVTGTSVDKETGLVTYTMGHPDVEIFQGSTHQSMGLSCYSCHMPETTKDGKTYRSHDASGSPLTNEAAMQSCLSCHSNGKIVSEPVDSADGMVNFVKGKQGEIAALENKVNEDVKKLYDLVLAAVQGGASDADLEQAREAYTTAKFYSNFCRGGATESGVKSPHNYDEMKDLLTRAQDLLDNAIGSF